jgi:hypothetical protein
MRHAILGTAMLLCAILTTLFAANALEQLGQSHAAPQARADAIAEIPTR